jgi:hypothetical protein
MMRAFLALGVVGLVVALGASEARADAVPPPPEDCPEGSRGETSHAGPSCVVVPCTSTSNLCEPGKSCKPRGFCLIGTDPKVEGGTCEDTPDCASPAVCRKVPVCAAPEADSGCACGEARGASTGAGLGAVALGLGVVVMASARRRQGRASRHRRA